MNRLLFDTESDGFVKDATKVHCMVLVDVDTGEVLDYKPSEVDAGLSVLDKADTVIGHNVQRHDLPLLLKLKGFRLRQGVTVRDTLICARVIKPNVRDTDAELIARGKFPKKGSEGDSIIGKHSLEAWGHRLGVPKTVFKGPWEIWTPTMHSYMIDDGATNLALWRYLDVDQYRQEPIELEHRIARVCDAIEEDGVPFDAVAAGRLHSNLVAKRDTVETTLKHQFGSWLAPVSPNKAKSIFFPKKPDAKKGYWGEYIEGPDAARILLDDDISDLMEDGKLKKIPRKRIFKGYPFTKLKVVEFNPGSRQHIAKVLMDRGWKPTELTPTGRPEVNENIVAGLVQQFPEAAGLADYLMLDKRTGQIAGGEQAWLKHVDQNGRIHGVVNPMGTTTSRASHFGPNLAQVPAAASPYGKECRGLFLAGPGMPLGWVAVGADMDGLELRGFAHYLKPLDGGRYEELVLSGDPHWENVLAMGLISLCARDKHSKLHAILREVGAKRFIYAFIYGCGNQKAGEIVLDACLGAQKIGINGPFEKFFHGRMPNETKLAKVGKVIRDSFLKKTDGLAELKEKIGSQVQKFGWVRGLDGRIIPTRSEHSALNFLIQSAGAILCKRWGADAFDDLCTSYKRGWDGDFVFCLWIHDEYQVACKKTIAEDVGETLAKYARKAGAPYGFRVRLDSSYTIGRSWADTH